MTKKELSKKILDRYTQDEWEALEKDTLGVPVNKSNREVLLKFKEDSAALDDTSGRRRPSSRLFKGDVDDDAVSKLTDSLQDFLSEVWADEPKAHKYVIDVCLIKTYIYDLPMHPEESVHYYTVVRDGKAEYYCPAKTDSLICSCCRSKYCSELYQRWDEITEETKTSKGELSAKIQRQIFEAGLLESGVLDTKDLVFHQDVRTQCEKNQCGAYGTTWACPPAVGSLEECMDNIMKYNRFQLFSKAYLLKDTMDMKEALSAMSNFKKCTRDLGKRLKEFDHDHIILSNESCDRCKKCTYPDSPCRFEEDLQPSIEGFGFYVLELSRLADIKYINGQSTATFFGAVIYNEE